MIKVVIIDDDIFVSGALKTILESSGDITVPATGCDGKEALELYKKYRPDVLLMDIRMKEVSASVSLSALASSLSSYSASASAS